MTMICERCGGLVTWRGPLSALTHTQCESCGGINCQMPEDSDGKCWECDAAASGEGAYPELCEQYSTMMAAEVAEAEAAYRRPPCQECGAMTPEEAESKCRCSGDKDGCHGDVLWPD